MKQLYFLPLLLSLFFPFLSVSAQTTEEIKSPIAFSFLNKTASMDRTGNCTQEDVMNLLDDNSKKWIASVECNDVSLNNGIYGLDMGTRYVGTIDEMLPSIKFNFISQQLFKAIRIRIYGEYKGQNINPVTLELNGEPISMEGQLGKFSATDGIFKGWQYGSSALLQSIPVRSITIKGNCEDIKIVGMSIYFSGMEEGSEEGGDDGEDNGDDNPGVSTGVNGVQQDASATYEYFDMQGRRLKSAPVSGLYIRRSAGKTEKLIAR